MNAPYVTQLAEDGSIDDLMARNVDVVHLERVADGEWALRLDCAGEPSVIVSLRSSKFINAVEEER